MLLRRANAKLFFYTRKINFKGKNSRPRSCGENIKDFNDLFCGLSLPPNSNVFIYAGLRKLYKILNLSYNDITDMIIEKILENYHVDTVFTASFSPSFRASGLYSVLHTRAEFGAFSELARQKAIYRTNDAIHSVSIHGKIPNYIKNLDHSRTFGENGVFAQMKKENTYILNIGTERLVSTYLHYIEEEQSVPYKIRPALYTGVSISDHKTYSKINQINHKYTFPCEFNRSKIERELLKNNALEKIDNFGVDIRLFNTARLHDVISPRVKEKPYYLVTF